MGYTELKLLEQENEKKLDEFWGLKLQPSIDNTLRHWKISYIDHRCKSQTTTLVELIDKLNTLNTKNKRFYHIYLAQKEKIEKLETKIKKLESMLEIYE